VILFKATPSEPSTGDLQESGVVAEQPVAASVSEASPELSDSGVLVEPVPTASDAQVTVLL
jgi:hypothetical protein